MNATTDQHPLAILARIETLHTEFDKQAQALLTTLAEHQQTSEQRAREFGNVARATMVAIDEYMRAVRPATPAITAERMLELREQDAHISDDARDAEKLAELANELNGLLADHGHGVMTDDVLASLWCSVPCDTFGMLNDWTARLGLDEDKVRKVVSDLFELLDDDASVLVLSDVFACHVREALTLEQLEEVCRRNKADPEAQGDSICHSHDFIDTNECMLEALDCLGLDCDPSSMQDAELMNRAWTMAKRRGFDEVVLS